MADVVDHLNHPVQSCWPEKPSHPYALPPALRSSPNQAHTAQFHPTSGYTYALGKNTLQRIQDDKYHEKQNTNIHWPFPNYGEWSLGRFLTENFMQTQINMFLKLAWVSPLMHCQISCQLPPHYHQFDNKQKPLFTSARELLDWMDILPSGPKWHITELKVDSYNIEKKTELIWWDGLEVIESLFGNPIFAQNMCFDPLRMWEGTDVEYGEWFTANELFCIQV